MVTQNSLVSIGVLAHNEEARIAKTLQTLFAQDVFEKFQTEVVIIANGCMDETAPVARRTVQNHQLVWSVLGSARVEELAVAGKSNAWNQFVHDFSSRAATVLVLMDADIELLQQNTISSMIQTLEANTQAAVCVDRPLKDIDLSTKRSFFRRLLLGATPEIDQDNVGLCGQLYCARSSQLRLIRLPAEIFVEDGFLRALLLTDGFTKPENRRRIVLDSTARHIFASVATPLELYRHEVWLVTGSIVNMLLFERFGAECTPNQSAMILMKNWQEQDPQWLNRYIKLRAQERGWGLLPRPWWIRRWTRLRGLSLAQKIGRFPSAVAAAAMDMWIFIAAIRDVRRGGASGYWARKSIKQS